MKNVTLAMLSVFAGPAVSPAADGLAPLVVETISTRLTTEAVPIHASGVFARRNESILSFKTGGLIQTIAVRPGDVVKAGEVLAALRLDEIDAQVAQARAGADKARRDLGRVEALQLDRVVTLENAQDSRTAFAVAEAALRTAEFNRTHSVIVAPTAGRILRRHAEPDEIAAPGRPILGFAAEAGGWIARVGVSEREVVRLKLGNRAELAWRGGALAEARVTQIAEGVDPATRTIEVELELTGAAPAGLRSGFVADVRLFPEPGAARSVVPLAALVEGADLRAHLFVLAADGRTARRVAVDVEAIDRDSAYLRDPLPGDARIVTTGAEFVSDGRAVTIAPRIPEANPR